MARWVRRPSGPSRHRDSGAVPVGWFRFRNDPSPGAPIARSSARPRPRLRPRRPSSPAPCLACARARRGRGPKVAIIVGPVGSMTSRLPQQRQPRRERGRRGRRDGREGVLAEGDLVEGPGRGGRRERHRLLRPWQRLPEPVYARHRVHRPRQRLGPNRTTTNGDSDNWSTTMVYCGEKAFLGTLTASDGGGAAHVLQRRADTPAPGFTMVYAQAHYAPGFGERYKESDPITTLSQARQRVTNYSTPVLRLGGGGYFATAYSDAHEIVARLLTQPDSTYRRHLPAPGSGYCGSEARRDVHPDVAGAKVWVQRTASVASTSATPTTGTPSPATLTAGSVGGSRPALHRHRRPSSGTPSLGCRARDHATAAAPRQFCPKGVLTRGQLASPGRRRSTCRPPTTTSIADDEGSPHEDDINRLGGGRASPAAAATATTARPARPSRPAGQRLARALRPAGHRRPTTSPTTTASPTRPNINRIAAAGITTGCGDGRFCPDGTASAGQAAAFLRKRVRLTPASSVLFRTGPHRPRVRAMFNRVAGLSAADLLSLAVRRRHPSLQRTRRRRRRRSADCGAGASAPTVHAEMLAEHAGEPGRRSRRARRPQPIATAGAEGQRRPRRAASAGSPACRTASATRSSATCRTGAVERATMANLDYDLVSTHRVLLGRRQTRRNAAKTPADPHGWSGWNSAAHDGRDLDGTCARRQGRADRHDDGLGRRLPRHEHAAQRAGRTGLAWRDRSPGRDRARTPMASTSTSSRCRTRSSRPTRVRAQGEERARRAGRRRLSHGGGHRRSGELERGLRARRQCGCEPVAPALAGQRGRDHGHGVRLQLVRIRACAAASRRSTARTRWTRASDGGVPASSSPRRSSSGACRTTGERGRRPRRDRNGRTCSKAGRAPAASWASTYVDARSAAADNGRRWDNAGQVPWYRYRSSTYDTWVQGYYDDPASLDGQVRASSRRTGRARHRHLAPVDGRVTSRAVEHDRGGVRRRPSPTSPARRSGGGHHLGLPTRDHGRLQRHEVLPRRDLTARRDGHGPGRRSGSAGHRTDLLHR